MHLKYFSIVWNAYYATKFERIESLNIIDLFLNFIHFFPTFLIVTCYPCFVKCLVEFLVILSLLFYLFRSFLNTHKNYTIFGRLPFENNIFYAIRSLQIHTHITITIIRLHFTVLYTSKHLFIITVCRKFRFVRRCRCR